MSDGTEDMTKAQRLALQAAEAPILRNASEKTLARRVALVDKDGKVTGYTSGREVLKGLAKANELEHVVEEGKRPKTVICKNCGKQVKVPRSGGKVPSVCPAGCTRRCSTPSCDGDVSAASATKKARRSRRPLCRGCASRAKWAAKTPEERSAPARRRNAARSPEQRSAIMRKASRSLTAAQRSAIAHKANASKTPEQRSRMASHAAIAGAAKRHPSREARRARVAEIIRLSPRESAVSITDALRYEGYECSTATVSRDLAHVRSLKQEAGADR